MLLCRVFEPINWWWWWWRWWWWCSIAVWRFSLSFPHKNRHTHTLAGSHLITNKCIEDDTKTATRQRLDCIKNKKNKIKYGEKRFSICRMEFYTPCNVARSRHWFRQVTASCNVAGMWLWNRDHEFTKWQHPVMWYVAVGWHATEFAQTSAVLEFYIWFSFPHITAVDTSFCTSLRNFIQIGPSSAEKNNVMSIFKMANLSHLIVGIQ